MHASRLLRVSAAACINKTKTLICQQRFIHPLLGVPWSRCHKSPRCNLKWWSSNQKNWGHVPLSWLSQDRLLGYYVPVPVNLYWIFVYRIDGLSGDFDDVITVQLICSWKVFANLMGMPSNENVVFTIAHF